MVHAVANPTNDAKVVIKLFMKIISSRLVDLKTLIGDGGPHLSNQTFKNLLKKYGIIHNYIDMISKI